MKNFMILLLLLLPASCISRLEYQTLNPTIPQEIIKRKDIDIALVLSGGGSKGYAHIGAIEVLEKNNIPIDLIVGTSIGGIVGALYADDPNVESLKKKIKRFSPEKALDTHFSSILYGPVTGDYIIDFLCKNLKSHNIEDFKIPFVAVATSLETNEPFLFMIGPAIPALHASAAVPGIFTPIYVYGHHLIDGGAVENVPVRTAKKFSPKMIIAINISSPPDLFLYDKETFIHANRLGVAYQALSIAFYELSKKQALEADIAISPDLAKFGFLEANDNEAKLMFMAGKKSAEEAIKKIKTQMYKLGISTKKRDATSNGKLERLEIYQK